MNADYFRVLASSAVGRHAIAPIFAKEEFRRLACEFRAKADQSVGVWMEWDARTGTQLIDR